MAKKVFYDDDARKRVLGRHRDAGQRNVSALDHPVQPPADHHVGRGSGGR